MKKINLEIDHQKDVNQTAKEEKFTKINRCIKLLEQYEHLVKHTKEQDEEIRTLQDKINGME